MNWGVELTGAAVANSRDTDPAPPAAQTDGHGAHVAGTAAGAEVRDAAGKVLVPAGLAPLATIAAVRAIQVDGGTGNTVLAVKWIFQKATELGLPCVINMSFGSHLHGHDGSDASSRAMLALCRDKATGTYLPGRVLVAAAGNERGDAIHLRRTLPANGGNFEVGAVRFPAQLAQNVVIWVRDPNGTCPVSFPVSAYVYSQARDRRHRRDEGDPARQPGGRHDEGSEPGGHLRRAAHARSVSATELSQSVNGDHSFRLLFLEHPATDRHHPRAGDAGQPVGHRADQPHLDATGRAPLDGRRRWCVHHRQHRRRQALPGRSSRRVRRRDQRRRCNLAAELDGHRRHRAQPSGAHQTEGDHELLVAGTAPGQLDPTRQIHPRSRPRGRLDRRHRTGIAAAVRPLDPGRRRRRG